MTVNAPFNVYDFFGILFPGTLALLLASLFYPPLWSYVASGGEWATAALVVVFAYIAGEVVAALSRLIIGGLRDQADGWKKLSRHERDLLTVWLRDHCVPGASQEALEKSRFDLAYSLVGNRAPAYPIFLARSDLNRSLSFLCGAATLTGFAGALGLPLSVPLSLPRLITFSATSVLLGGLLFWRARYFYERATKAVYYSAFQCFADKRQPGVASRAS